ncbi:MAG TPA: YggT family protein, partial [Gemmatimonadales bacterium]|nr:YggT family protein [Gemmatimonadales bacterium]
MAETILLVVRGAVALGCGAAGVLALTHWLVRRGTLSPFGGWARLVRGAGAGVVRPMERQLVRRGATPQDAPYWVLGVAVAGGLVAISLTQWVLGYLAATSSALTAGPRGVLAFAVSTACDLLALALIVRAIGSWFGVGRWTRWMRPMYLATDWIVGPLQRIIPPIGMFDLTPIVAYLLVTFLLR